MEIKAFRRFVKGLTEENITADQPHVNERCEEFGITLNGVKNLLLDPNSPLVRLVDARQGVYKAYYRFGNRTEIKIVFDVHTHRSIFVRAVRLLTKESRSRCIFKFEELEEDHDW